VWEDHLLPLLTCKDAARLGRTCKALRGVVREHFKDLGGIKLEKLQAALTTFPRARSVAPYRCRAWGESRDGGAGGVAARGGAWGGHHDVTTRTTRESDLTSDDDAVDDTIHAALRGGALPSLKTVAVQPDGSRPTEPH
jgi:hypothetical protein